MRIGVLGGTFDPPHIGHLILAEYAKEQLSLDKILFIPAGDPWRKADRDVTPATHRLAMTLLAVQGNRSFEVDDCEVRREGATYTVETLQFLRTRLQKDDELIFIVGQDALADTPTWREPQGIAAVAQIAVAPRTEVELPADLPFDRKSLLIVDMPPIDVSSTNLRERARRGLSLRYQVPAAVETYIHDNHLYGT